VKEPDRLLQLHGAGLPPRRLLGSYWSVLGLSLATIRPRASNHICSRCRRYSDQAGWRRHRLGQLGHSRRQRQPPIVGWIKEVTGSFSGGLYALAGLA
jgi:hypothetical protein